MNVKSILIGAAIYIVLAILIGYLVSSLAIYAAAIAALVAGIYMGRVAVSVMNALLQGFLVGLIGGIIGGFLTPYLPTLTGMNLGVVIGGPLATLVGLVSTALPWLAPLSFMAIVGFIFGAVGGFVGFKYLHKK